MHYSSGTNALIQRGTLVISLYVIPETVMEPERGLRGQFVQPSPFVGGETEARRAEDICPNLEELRLHPR